MSQRAVKMKVALVFPYFLEHITKSPPLGIAYLAAVLEKSNISVQIIDTTFNQDWMWVGKALSNSKADVVGISSTTPMMDAAFKTAELAKRMMQDAKIVLGGPHATIFPHHTLKNSNVDIVVQGEGEQSLLELIETLDGNGDLRKVQGIYYKVEGNVVATPRRPYLENLDELPFPAWHLLPTMEKYLEVSGRRGVMLASRGCPFNCSYCQPTLREIFGSKVRYRSPENVVDEMDYTIKKYGLLKLNFHDDTFTVNKKWVTEVCRLILGRGIKIAWSCNSRVNTVSEDLLLTMRKAGCMQLEFGVESGSQEILDKTLQKQITVEQTRKAFQLCHRHRIKAHAFIMLGSPGETIGTLKETMDLVKEIKPDAIDVSRTTALPGTKLYDMAIEQKGLMKNLPEWSDFYYRDFRSIPFNLQVPEEVIVGMKNALFLMVGVNRIVRFAFFEDLLDMARFFQKNPAQATKYALYFVKRVVQRLET